MLISSHHEDKYIELWNIDVNVLLLISTIYELFMDIKSQSNVKKWRSDIIDADLNLMS